MGKSDKKFSNSGKKKSKKQKTTEPAVSWRETLLAYQINIKEKTLEDIRYEMKILEDDNLRLTERNKQLKSEQAFLLEDLMKATKEIDNRATLVTKEEVLLQMKDNWTTKAKNVQALEELKNNLANRDEEILSQCHLVGYWKQFRDQGQHEHEKQIHLLLEVTSDMEETFETMSGHMKTSLSNVKKDIEQNTMEMLDQQKYIATEKAIEKMNKYSRREVIDNDWLLREIALHRKATEELMKVVEKLEEENLLTLSDLFHCQMEDFRVSRSFFMTQFLGKEDSLDKVSILEIDLNRLKMEASNPELIVHVANIITPEDDSNDTLAEYLHLHDNSDDHLKLGPLEQRLLTVTGAKLDIHKSHSPSLDELKAKFLDPEEWPITQPMLIDALELSWLDNPTTSASK